MIRLFSILLLLLGASLLNAQNYKVMVDVYVGTKVEDKFYFNMSVGDSQTKGFDGKLLAKRYRAQGYPHQFIQKQESEKKIERQIQREEEKSEFETAEDLLTTLDRDLDTLKRRLKTEVDSLDLTQEKLDVLRDIIGLGDTPAFNKAFRDFQRKYDMIKPEADVAYERLLRKRPTNTGDVDYIDVGSYCDIEIIKGNATAIMCNLNFAYSRYGSSFYTDGNNNDNNITKFPLYERVEKLDVQDLTITVNKPYCIQFGRRSTEEMKSLQEALSSTTVFGGRGGAVRTNPMMGLTESPLDAEGLYSEIRTKFKTDTHKTIRFVITVKKL